jgi:hypothetical protein
VNFIFIAFIFCLSRKIYRFALMCLIASPTMFLHGKLLMIIATNIKVFVLLALLLYNNNCDKRTIINTHIHKLIHANIDSNTKSSMRAIKISICYTERLFAGFYWLLFLIFSLLTFDSTWLLKTFFLPSRNIFRKL